MGKATLDKSLLDFLAEPSSGTLEDKVRLFVIYFICSQAITENELNKYEATLQSLGCDLSPIAYVKRWK